MYTFIYLYMYVYICIHTYICKFHVNVCTQMNIYIYLTLLISCYLCHLLKKFFFGDIGVWNQQGLLPIKSYPLSLFSFSYFLDGVLRFWILSISASQVAWIMGPMWVTTSGPFCFLKEIVYSIWKFFFSIMDIFIYHWRVCNTC
jgi:hypothetical protein